jgi:serine/threonine protein kinase
MRTRPDLPPEQPGPLLNGLSEPMPSPEDLRLGQALEEFLAAQEAGQRPNRREFCQRYPDIAGRLAECLDGLDFVNAAARELDPVDPEPGAPPATGIREGARLGDYLLLREIGRGGMGVVYEAEQLSLGRRVALKVLPLATALDPRHLQRFKNEAQAAAGLHHPHIVPVYAVGSEAGVHYYAMQFIDGQTLAAAIRDLRHGAGLGDSEPISIAWPPETNGSAAAEEQGSTATLPPTESPGAGAEGRATTIISSDGSHRSSAFFRAAARLTLQAAEALEHAHQMGVVHRDIKPANLLVDDRGNVWVTDFGLAFFRRDAGLTQSGALLGTLRYMSPEQALAKRGLVDHRTDIYSLGVTLYELLTLEVAFPGADRQEMVRQVTQDEPRPLCRINPAIPTDLETIVLKAMTKEPEGRYATAQELADDLRRFLCDEPIRARRATLGQRLTKWVRRHPAVFRSAAVLGVTLVACLAISTLLIWQAKKEAEKQRRIADWKSDTANRQWERAERKSRIAEEKSDLARKAVDEMYAQVYKWLAHMPNTEPIQKEFLIKARKLFQQFADEETRDNPEARLKIVQAYACIAEIHERLGDSRASASAWDQAGKVADRLVADYPSRSPYRLEQANCYLGKAKLLLAGDHPQDAINSVEQARRILERLAARPGGDPMPFHQLAGSYHLLGEALRTARRYRDADRAYLLAIDLYRHVLKAFPKYEEMPSSLAKVYNNRGNLLEFLARPRSRRLPQQTILAARAAALGLSSPRGPGLLMAAAAFATRGVELRVYRAAAEDAYRSAIDIMEKLTATHPTYPDYQFDLAIARHNLGWLYFQHGDAKSAERQFEQALPRLERLTKNFSNIPNYWSTLGGLRSNWAIVLRSHGDWARARVMLEQAIALQKTALKAAPDNASFQRRLWDTYFLLADNLIREGQLDRAARAAAKLAHAVPGETWRGPFSAIQFVVRCAAAVDKDKSLSSTRRANLWQKYAAQIRSLVREAAQKCQNDPEGQIALAWFLAVAEDPRFRDARRAREFAQKALAHDQAQGRYWNALGVAEYRLGNWREAIGRIEEGIRLRGSARPVDAFFLAMAHWRAGHKNKAKRLYHELKGVKAPETDEETRVVRDEATRLMEAHQPPAKDAP